MLAPILPRPIIPSCMLFLPSREKFAESFRPVAKPGYCAGRNSPGKKYGIRRSRSGRILRQGLLNRLGQLGEIALYILAKVHAQSATTALCEHREIAASLGRFYHAKSVFLPGNRQIGSIVAGNLQEHAGVWTALVGLTGGVQKPRTKAQAGGNFFRVAHPMTNGLQGFLVRCVHSDGC